MPTNVTAKKRQSMLFRDERTEAAFIRNNFCKQISDPVDQKDQNKIKTRKNLKLKLTHK